MEDRRLVKKVVLREMIFITKEEDKKENGWTM